MLGTIPFVQEFLILMSWKIIYIIDGEHLRLNHPSPWLALNLFSSVCYTKRGGIVFCISWSGIFLLYTVLNFRNYITSIGFKNWSLMVPSTLLSQFKVHYIMQHHCLSLKLYHKFGLKQTILSRRAYPVIMNCYMKSNKIPKVTKN